MVFRQQLLATLLACRLAAMEKNAHSLQYFLATRLQGNRRASELLL